MTVLKCDRCGATQKDPKDLNGWVEVSFAVYGKQDDCRQYHEHWCKKCAEEMSRTRYANDIRRSHLCPEAVKPFGM